MSTTNIVTIPNLGVEACFTPREPMKAGRPDRKYALRAGASLPAIQGVVDWTKNDALQFPILGNNRVGDCMYAMGLHQDQTWTGNIGQESSFDEATVVQYYRRLSGGDHGLDEGTLVGAWKQGLVGNPDVSILDALDIDVTNPALVRSAIYFFGGVCFMLAVPNRWINDADTGAVWDAPAIPNPMNGHGVLWNGVDARGYYKLQTWGTHVFITPAGVEHCDPSGFVVFSRRWFDPRTGLAPNGLHYDQLAALWVQAGGKPLAACPFPSPFPPS